MHFTVLRFDSIDSTNSEALKEARLGAGEGLCVVARRQTAGRGRMGRSWISPADAGLYLSIVLRPTLDTKYLPLLTLMTAVAVSDTLSETYGLKPDIKWPNDLLVNEKKISGILAETTESPAGLAVIVGVGINLRQTNYPPDIAATATSLTEAIGEPTAEIETSVLEEQLLRFFDYWYGILQGSNGSGEIINAWRERSTYFSGKSVSVTLEHDSVTGITDGLDKSGALRVRQPDGSVVLIQSGDVHKLR
jgi:BirA family biotin operon repressor/biotin-[acetyl-CoA-carboxylase] ligase